MNQIVQVESDRVNIKELSAKMADMELKFDVLDRQHAISTFNLRGDTIDRYVNDARTGVKSGNDHVIACCKIVMNMGESVESRDFHEWLYTNFIGEVHLAKQTIRYIAQRTFEIDSPRTAHLPPAHRAAIAAFSPEYADDAIDPTKKYKVYLIDDPKGREYKWVSFGDMTDAEIDQVLTPAGFERGKEFQFARIDSRDRTKEERYIRDNTVWLPRGRATMVEVLKYVSDMIDYCDDLETAKTNAECIDLLAKKASTHITKVEKGELPDTLPSTPKRPKTIRKRK